MRRWSGVALSNAGAGWRCSASAQWLLNNQNTICWRAWPIVAQLQHSAHILYLSARQTYGSSCCPHFKTDLYSTHN